MRSRTVIKSLSAFETKTIEEKLPEFKQMIDKAWNEDADCLTTASAFSDNPMLFYLAMLYASDRGITVVLIPKKQFERNYEKS